MIRRTIRLVWTGAVLAFLAYVLFFVRLGERTPFQHLMRVAGTEEAQELGREVGEATERISKKIGEQVNEATKPPEQDAGTSQVPKLVSDNLGGLAGDAHERAQRLEATREEDSR